MIANNRQINRNSIKKSCGKENITSRERERELERMFESHLSH